MITIVSGFPRSGTSMMMQCLKAGGVQVVFDRYRERLNLAPYVPNKHGFYEVGSDVYMQLGFAATLPDNIAVKIQILGLPTLSPGSQYKIIFMRRDPVEIKSSYQAAFPKDDFDEIYGDWPNRYWRALESIKGIMAMRRDVEILELWFDKVIENPKQTMEQVKAFGVPINIKQAAKQIDPTQYRHKRLSERETQISLVS